jgi:hypothetical protein
MTANLLKRHIDPAQLILADRVVGWFALRMV